jgi:predicted TIM-barrel fold metal-dependent hydrolase
VGQTFTMNVVDTHVHVWDLSQFSYSWTNAVPLLNRSFLIEEYDDATRNVESLRIVLVEADVDEPHMTKEAGYLLALADRDPRIAGVVVSGRPESPDFASYLEGIAGSSKLKGIRRVLHTQPDELAKSELFAENIRSLEEYGLTFDLCVLDHQLPVAIDLVKACPAVSFILDHCGCPQPKNKDFDAWSERIGQIASFSNVACKISGLVGYTGHDDWSVEDVRLKFEWVVRCFGWDRLVFGSDWPVCTLSTCPREWLDIMRALTRDQSEGNQRKLLSENAQRLYRL